MTAFIIWIILIALALAAYSAILWRRSRGRFRFQARLTILFFLFALVPTIPLTLSLSILLTKSTELFMLPEIEESLSESLQLLRGQLLAQTREFMDSNPNLDDIKKEQLEEKGICYAGKVAVTGDSVEVMWMLIAGKPVAFTGDRLWPENLAALEPGNHQDFLAVFGGREYFELYRKNEDYAIGFIGIELPEEFSTARRKITATLRHYSSLSLLRETFVSQGLVWAGAILVVILLTVLAIIIGKNFSRGISTPIALLTAGVSRVAEGDLDHRVKVKAKDEIAFLIESFNNMTEELQKSRINLQRMERAAAWRDVARQISHEIKNPLTPMRMSLHRIRKKLGDNTALDADVEEALSIMEEEIESMRRMADEFSEFARMPHMTLKPENIVDTVRQSVKLFESDAHKISIRVDADSNVQQVSIDQEQFRRVIHNLLKNAMEASSDGDEVLVKIERFEKENKKAHIRIIDHGCGMDQETLKNIYTPYFTTKKSGSGLGMYIVKRIIEDHGGIITIDSQPNRGTTVHIYI